MPSIAQCRRISGSLFLTGNITLFLGNLAQTNTLQLIAALLFMTCSISLMLSAKNHRWLFWGGFAVIVGYSLVALGASGGGTLMQHIGGVAGFVGGLLILRSALQSETGKQYNFPPPLDLLDKYPLAAAGVVEGVCCFSFAIGALLSQDYRLGFVSAMWTIAHGFLIASDIPLRRRFGAV